MTGLVVDIAKSMVQYYKNKSYEFNMQSVYNFVLDIMGQYGHACKHTVLTNRTPLKQGALSSFAAINM